MFMCTYIDIECYHLPVNRKTAHNAMMTFTDTENKHNILNNSILFSIF